MRRSGKIAKYFWAAAPVIAAAALFFLPFAFGPFHIKPRLALVPIFYFANAKDDTPGIASVLTLALIADFTDGGIAGMNVFLWLLMYSTVRWQKVAVFEGLNETWAAFAACAGAMAVLKWAVSMAAGGTFALAQEALDCAALALAYPLLWPLMRRIRLEKSGGLA